MGFIEGRTRFGEVTRPTIYIAVLAAVLMLPVLLLLAFPARALAVADLSITKEGPPPVEPGERFDYILTVSNTGADPAADVKVEDKLPADVTFEDFEAPDSFNCNEAGGTATCTIPTLAAEKSRTIILKVRSDPAFVGKVTNQATASSVDDADSPARSEEVITTIAPRLVINKQADPNPVRTEAILAYTLRVENQSETPANGVTIRDELPIDLVDFRSVDSGDFECDYKAGIVKCSNGSLAPGEIGKVEITVEPEKAETIENTAAVFIQDVREALDTDTETTKAIGGGDGPDGPDGPNGPDVPEEPDGPDVPQGDQCSPVINLDTGDPVEVISGTDPVEGTFKNFYNDTLPLRIAYATSSEDGSLTITLTRKGNGMTILDKTINGKKRGVEEVDTESGVTYDFVISPDDQGYAVDLQIGSGTDEPCTNPDDLDPPAGPGGDDDTNGDNGANEADDANDVIDDTISDNPLPNTGGPFLVGLAVIALGLSVLGGATVVRTGVRRRDR